MLIKKVRYAPRYWENANNILIYKDKEKALQDWAESQIVKIVVTEERKK